MDDDVELSIIHFPLITTSPSWDFQFIFKSPSSFTIMKLLGAVQWLCQMLIRKSHHHCLPRFLSLFGWWSDSNDQLFPIFPQFVALIFTNLSTSVMTAMTWWCLSIIILINYLEDRILRFTLEDLFNCGLQNQETI